MVLAADFNDTGSLACKLEKLFNARSLKRITIIQIHHFWVKTTARKPQYITHHSWYLKRSFTMDDRLVLALLASCSQWLLGLIEEIIQTQALPRPEFDKAWKSGSKRNQRRKIWTRIPGLPYRKSPLLERSSYCPRAGIPRNWAQGLKGFGGEISGAQPVVQVLERGGIVYVIGTFLEHYSKYRKRDPGVEGLLSALSALNLSARK